MHDCKCKVLPLDVNVKLSKYGEDILDVLTYPYLDLVGPIVVEQYCKYCSWLAVRDRIYLM
jgi:hypothetical protein